MGKDLLHQIVRSHPNLYNTKGEHCNLDFEKHRLRLWPAEVSVKSLDDFSNCSRWFRMTKMANETAIVSADKYNMTKSCSEK